MVAHARWMYRAALRRAESRAMHRRDDLPETDPALTQRLRCGGLDRVWVAPDPRRWPAASTPEAVAAW